MAEQRCASCRHMVSLHRLDRKAGTRRECWSVDQRTLRWPGCRCEQFVAAAPAEPRGGEGE